MIRHHCTASIPHASAALRGLVILLVLCGLVLMPAHAHDDSSLEEADDVCQLCVHGSSGHVGPVSLSIAYHRPELPAVSRAFSVAEVAVPVRVCRGPPRG
jgi:hypothetical protein